MTYPLSNVTTAIYTVSYEEKKTFWNIHYLRIFSFIDSKTGVIGIDIRFAAELAEDFQLLAYATYPKAAVIDNTGDCQLVDNV